MGGTGDEFVMKRAGEDTMAQYRAANTNPTGVVAKGVKRRREGPPPPPTPPKKKKKREEENSAGCDEWTEAARACGSG